MKRHTIASTLALIVGLGVYAPATATASGPLLSGYGGPGAGSQVIVGSGLIGGGGASSGGSGGGSGAGSPGIATSVGSSTSGTASRASAGAGSQGERSSSHASARGSATHPGAAGATPPIPNLQAGQAANASSPAWFSGANLLALLLAAGVLVLLGLATVRLARTQHH
jgi:hypothetical protein